MKRRFFEPRGGFRLALALGAALSMMILAPPGGARQAPDALDVQHVRGPVYMLAGAGGNITASIGPDGVLLVDAGTAEMSGQVVAVIRDLQNSLLTSGRQPLGFAAETRSSLDAMRATPAPPKPIRYIINTHLHPDHAGGNATLARAGETISAGNVGTGPGIALIHAHENVLLRMTAADSSASADGGRLPFENWPTDAYIGEYFKMPYFNGEGIQLIHQPNAHTDGDSLVWFRGSDIIATGDLFVMNSYPVIDIANGGSVQGIVDALNYVLDLGFAEFRLEGGTMIIPGHGRMSDLTDVAYYRDMVTILRDRIADAINRGMTLDETQAEALTADYDPRFGRTSGFWTTENFVEAVYRSLRAE